MRTLLIALALTSSAAAQTVVPVGPFRSVELQNGGHVTVRYAATQRVTLLSGSPRCARVRVDDGQRLVINNTGCHGDHQRLEVEVLTPVVAAAAVSNGGRLETDGAFPAQAELEVHVEQGGMLDVRAIAADVVDASVDSGGRIFTHARRTLTANVYSGGGITYWGDPRVTQSVQDGGAVMRGDD
ncbi:MAG TPA: DUF2807 domain-containing protein [Thermoanaerobaculia bacterium]|nr:DUF2807 domain-containing protein [Thermoanaerobaculia bacterium]